MGSEFTFILFLIKNSFIVIGDMAPRVFGYIWVSLDLEVSSHLTRSNVMYLVRSEAHE